MSDSKTINLDNLTVDEVNLMLTGLAQLPYKDSAGLIAKVRQQADTQLADKQTEQSV